MVVYPIIWQDRLKQQDVSCMEVQCQCVFIQDTSQLQTKYIYQLAIGM